MKTSILILSISLLLILTFAFEWKVLKYVIHRILQIKLIYLLPIVFFLHCLFGCSSYVQYSEELLTADSLAYVNPVAALQLLDSLAPYMPDEKESTRYYHSLLTVKARDKAFVPHESDSLVLAVLDYYEDSKDKDLLAEAYYYAGRVTSDLGDAPKALYYFQKALDAFKQISDQNNKERYVQLRSCIHSQMGYLFVLQNLHDYAYSSFYDGFCGDSISGDTLGMLYHLRDIGQCLHQKGDENLALSYYNRAELLLRKSSNKTLLPTIILHKISSLLSLKQYDAAKELYYTNQSLVDSLNTTSAYSILGNLYSHMDAKDSASHYYKVLMKQGTVDQKCNADIWLAQYALDHSKPNEAMQYLKMLFVNLTEKRKQTNSEMVALSNASYNYQLREKENFAIKEKEIRTKNVNSILLSLLVILIISGSYFYHIVCSHKSQMKLQNENLKYIMKNQLDESLRTIEQNKERIKELENLYEGTNEKNKLLQEERSILLQQIDVAELNRQVIETFSQKLALTPIYEQIVEKCKSQQPMREEDFLILEAQIRDIHPSFVTQMYNLTSLSEKERRICYLIKINIAQHNISKLMCISEEGVSSARRRMFKKVFGKVGSAKDWDTFLCGM